MKKDHNRRCRNRRTTALLAIGVLLFGAACSKQVDTQPEPSVRTVPVPAAEATSAQITDAWSVQIPSGTTAADTDLSIVNDPPDVPAIPNEIARADITLRSGQPLQPLTFSYQLPTAVPEDSAVYLIGRHATNSELADASQPPPAATVIEAQLSPDRTIATATVSHLSFWQWVTDRVSDADHLISSLAGQRGTAPTCNAQPRPSWMDNVIYLDDQNAPMRVCSGKDPNDDEVAVVKIRNNRGGALVVTAPVAPQWAAVSVWDGQVDSIIADILTVTSESLGVPADARSRSWVLPPGGGVDIGFNQQSLERFHGVATIKSTFSTSSVAYALIWDAINEAVSDHTTLTALEMGMMTVCAADAAHKTVTAADATSLAAGVAAIIKCVVEKLPDILNAVKANVPERVWTGLVDKGLYRVASSITTKLAPLLGIAKATIVIGDLVATLALPDSAFEVTLTTVIKQALPDAPPPAANCTGTVVARQDVPHPKLRKVRVFLVLKTSQQTAGHGCVAAVADNGKVVLSTPIDIYGDALHFASPATDSTANVFITYNPGRYDGVLVLVPTNDGFEDPGWSDTKYGTRYDGKRAYYYAALEGPGADGKYTIVKSRNNCEPDCAGGTITGQTLHWNGSDYTP